MQRAIEGKQAARSRCDCRENKLEKTKGESVPGILLVPVQLVFCSDRPDFTENKNESEFDFIGLVFTWKYRKDSITGSLREA